MVRSSDSQYAAAGTDPPWPPLLNQDICPPGPGRTVAGWLPANTGLSH